MGHPRVAVIGLVLAIATRVPAQTGYYNLDAGRPVRTEDATPTAREDLDVQLAPFRVERYVGGLLRYRAEPKLSYGILPLTEIEVRVPMLSVVSPDSGVRPVTGLASVGIGVSHALTIEGRRLPAMAIAGEWLAPVGRFAPPQSSVGFKALLTKTFGLGRVHLNLGGGSYSVQPTGGAASPIGATPGCITPSRFVYVPLPPGGTYCPDTSRFVVPIIPDLPCEMRPAPTETAPVFLCDGGSGLIGAGTASGSGPGATSGTAANSTVSTPSHGRHTFVGLGVDHTFPLSSTLVAGSISSERFIGLYPTADLTVEIGLRQQVTPRLVLDAGVSRRLRGAAQFSAITAGATCTFARPFHFRDAR